MGSGRDVGDEIEANGDGYKTEYALCADGPYYLTFDKDYKLIGKEKRDLSRRDRAARVVFDNRGPYRKRLFADKCLCLDQRPHGIGKDLRADRLCYDRRSRHLLMDALDGTLISVCGDKYDGHIAYLSEPPAASIPSRPPQTLTSIRTPSGMMVPWRSNRAVSAVDARLQMSKPRADMASSRSRAIHQFILDNQELRSRGDEHWAMVSPYSFSGGASLWLNR